MQPQPIVLTPPTPVVSPAPLPPAAVPLAAPLPPPVTKRRMGDHDALRAAIYDQAKATLAKFEPVANARHTLSLHDVDYSHPGEFSTSDHKKAILANQSLARKLAGTWRLTDSVTGDVVSERRMTVARIPHLTRRGTFVLNGTEYAVANQSRLLPSVYARRRQDGVVEAHANLMPGKGVAHRYRIDPETGVFKLAVGQAEIPLLPVARALGATDDDLRKAWGKELFAVNQPFDSPHHVAKLYQRLVRKPDPDADAATMAAALRAEFEKAELDPFVTRKTLGKPFTRLDKEAFLTATNKLLRVARGEAKADDRDHMAYMRVLGPEDVIAERLSKDRGGLHQALWKASFKGNLDGMPSAFFDKTIKHAFLHSGLAQNPEGVSAAEFLDSGGRLTRLGEGAIGSHDSIPDESRAVHASQFGFVDPIRTPESAAIGVDAKLAFGVQKGSDGQLYAPFRDVKSGQVVYRSPRQMADLTVAFPGEMESGKPYVHGVRDGQIVTVPRAKVDLAGTHFEQTMSPLANFIPMKLAAKGGRTNMGSRYSISASSVVVIVRADGSVYRGPIGEYGHQAGDRACSIDKDTCQLVWKPVRAVTKHRCVSRMFDVTMRSGRSVTATYDHSFVTAGPDGRLAKLHTQDITPGTLLPVAGVLDVPGTVGATWDVPAGSNYNSHPAKSFPLDFNTGWVHGLYLSEGYVNANAAGTSATTFFSSTDDCVLNRVQDFFDRAGMRTGRLFNKRLGKAYQVTVAWLTLGNKLKVDFGHKACHKYVPPWVLCAPRCYREGLVAGYLAGNGVVTRRRQKAIRVDGSTRSRQLRDGLCDVLLSLGVSTSVKDGWANTGPGLPSARLYSFHVRVDHVSRLPRLYHAGKDAKLVANARAGCKSAVRFPMYADARQLVVAATDYSSLTRRRMHACGLSKAAMADVIGTSGDTVTHKWLRSAVDWDVVKSVEEVSAAGHEFVYDIDMDDNVFMCNGGVFVHNTAQALPMVKGEAPLVRNQVPGQAGRSFEELFGRHMGAVHAEQHGKVQKVTADAVTVRYEDGTVKTYDLYNNVPARKTRLHQDPLVAVGDRVAPGQLIAKSNYVDDKGHAAYGLNARVALTNWFAGSHGPYEDAFLVSASFAKRATSDHMYTHAVDWDDSTIKGRKAYATFFPGKYPKALLDNYDDDGVVKPGTKLEPNQPVVLLARRKPVTFGQVTRKAAGTVADGSVVWDHDHHGVVKDVVRTRDGVKVTVHTEAPAHTADKFATRYGTKGVAAKVADDDDMPHDEQGRPFDVVISPGSLPTRLNPAVLAELALGKVAAKTGKPEVYEDRADRDILAYAKQRLDEHGLSDTETIVDPKTGRKIPGVAAGTAYIMKLHHTASAKIQGRGLGSYDDKGAPQKGGDSSAGRMSMGDTYALISHGAASVLKDVKALRGTRNDEHWLATMGGYPPPPMRVPVMYQKYMAEMAAAGVKPVATGTKTHLMALTDADVKERAGDRELKSAETVNFARNMEPVKGGLFDVSHPGEWKKITFHEPMPNPAFELPIRTLLGMTEAQFNGVLVGKAKVNGESGPKAIATALSRIDVPRELALARAQIAGNRKGARDAAVKRLGYLKALEKHGLKPSDWMLSAAPVLPPTFRPVSSLVGGKSQIVADANLLYKELFDANEALKALHGKVGDLSAERGALYGAFKAVVGLGDPTHPKNKEKGVKGFLASIFGSSPKFGCYSADTEIMTRDGWVKFPDLRPNVDVGTLNPATAAFEWQTPTDIQRYPYIGELVHLTTARVDLLVTPSHRNWTRQLSDTWGFEPAYQTLARLTAFPHAVAFRVEDTAQSVEHDAGSGFEPYSGEVFCCTVPNGIVFVRRNGKPAFSGNSLQRNLLGTTVDLSGRGVATVNGDLSIDEVGVPEDMAWKVFHPFVVRRLVRDGVPRVEALKRVEEKHSVARRALLAEMDDRPVMLNRYPLLHRYGLLGHKPKLVAGHAIQVSPFVFKGFNLDLDGDCSLSLIFILLSREAMAKLPAAHNLLEQTMTMPANLTVLGHDDAQVILTHLEDFPHGDHIRTTEGANGPIEWYDVPEGVCVLAHVAETRRLEWRPVRFFTKHPQRLIEIVTLLSGRQIVTDDDPRAVYGVAFGETELKRFRPAEALEKKVLVPRARHVTAPVPAVTKTELRLSAYNTAAATENRRLLVDSSPLSEGLGYLIGAAAGDGWASGYDGKVPDAFCLAAITEEIPAKLDGVITSLFVDGDAPPRGVITGTNSYGRSKRHTWPSRGLGAMVADLIGRGAVNKHLPPWFLNTTREFRQGLFAGLMDTDGSVSTSKAVSKAKPQLVVAYHSVSLRLVEEVKLLAASLGIGGRIKRTKTTSTGNAFWSLQLSAVDVARWGAVGMVHSKKVEKIRTTPVSASCGKTAAGDMVPVTPALAEAMRKCVGHAKHKADRPAGQTTCYMALTKAIKDGRAPRGVVVQLAAVARDDVYKQHPDWPAFAAFVADDDVVWDAVVDVEKTDKREDGYDLTVPGAETFMSADGVILSNTMGIHVPASDEAVAEIKAKMLPSKNLIAPATMKATAFLPQTEYLQALHAASTAKEERARPVVFRRLSDAVAAYERGDIRMGTPIEIAEKG